MVARRYHIRSAGKNPPQGRFGQAKTIRGVFAVYYYKIGIMFPDNPRQLGFKYRKTGLAYHIADHEDMQSIHINDTNLI
jgi:hypothetical protein